MKSFFQKNGQIITLLLICLVVYKSNAQDWIYSYQYYDIEDGLNSRFIINVFQDSEGFIWIGTMNGINRYDGQEFISLLEKEHVHKIGEDKIGNIWVSEMEPNTNRIILKYIDKNSLESYLYHKLFNNRLSDIEFTNLLFEEIFFWFTTNEQKLYSFGKELVEETSFEYFCKNKPCEFITVTDSSYIYRHRDTLVERRCNSGDLLNQIKTPFRPRHCFPFLKENIICVFNLEKKKRENLNLNIGSFEFCPTQDIKFFRHKSVSDVNRLNEWDLSENRKGIFRGNNFFIKNDEGEIIFDFKTEFQQTKYQHIYTVFKDRQNNFWIGTNEGLIQLTIRKNIFQSFLKTETNIYTTRGICEKDEVLFVCTSKGQFRIDLNSLEEERITFRTADYGMILSEDKKHFWIGIYYHSLITKMNIDSKEETHIPERKHEDLHLFVHEDSLTNKLWISGNKGLYKLDSCTSNIIAVAIKGLEKPITSITDFYQEKDGLWLLGLNQIVKINPFTEEKIISYNSDFFNASNIQFSFLHVDKQGVFWMGTKGDGLLKWNPKTNVKKWIQKESGFLNLTLHAIYEDKHNRLWIPTDYGLVLFYKKTETTQVFLLKDGINHHEFNSASHFQAENGTLFFGGLNGIIGFNPNDYGLENMDEINVHFPLKFINITARDDKNRTSINLLPDLYTKKKLQLSSRTNNLKFKVALLDYVDNDKITYAYRLGEDLSWEYTSNNTIQYSSIPYGKNTINIKAQNAFGQWSEELNIPIYKEAPIWQRWWFFVSFSLLVIFIASLSFYFRTEYIKARSLELEQQVVSQTKKLQTQNQELLSLNKTKDKFFALVAHDLRSPLIALRGITEKINFFIDRGRFEDVNRLNDAVENAVNNVTKLLDNLLNWALVQKGDFPYEPQVIDLSLIMDETIELYKELAINKQLDMKMQITKGSYVYADRQAIFTVLRNLIDNAIKYTPARGYISILISKEPQRVSINIRNSVENISQQVVDSFFTLKKQGTPSAVKTKQGTGLGLVLCKELVELNKGNIAVEINNEKEIVFIIKLLMIAEDDEIKLANSDVFYDS